MTTPEEIDHDWVRERVHEYASGGLTLEERAALESHTNQCLPCAELLEQITQEDQEMRQLFNAIQPTPEFEDRLLQRWRMSAHSWQARRAARRIGLGLAAAVALVTTGVLGDYAVQTNVMSNSFSMQLTKTDGGFLPPWMRGGPRTRLIESVSGGADTSLVYEAASDVRFRYALDTAGRSKIGGQAGLEKMSKDDTRFASLNVGGNTGVTLYNGQRKYDAILGSGAVTVGGSTPNVTDSNGKSAYSTYSYDRSTLTKTGAGTLGLSGANTYTSVTTITAGTLALGDTRHDTFLRDAEMSPHYFAPSNGDGTWAERGLAGDGDGRDGKVIAEGKKGKSEEGRSVTGKAGISAEWGLHEREVLAADADVPVDGAKSGRASAPPPDPAAVRAAANRKIIRNGQMEFEVKNFDDAYGTINSIVTEEGGFVSSTTSEKLPNGKVRGTIVVRVEPGRLDRMVLKLRGLGDLKTQQIAASDVTKQYTDLEGELRANRGMEERLLNIIKTGKGEIKDLVEAEKQLGVYRERIEKIVGEMRYYDSQVALSTLAITCSEKDIGTPAVAEEREEVTMSVETEDVEQRYQDARRAIEQAGGRILTADLKSLDAGQLAASITCDVPPDKVDLLTAQLKGFGRTAHFVRARSQTTQGGTPEVGTKVQQKDTRLALSLYNLANIAPRQTTVITLACGNVEEAYQSILARVRKEATPTSKGGTIITSNLTGQRPEQMAADIRADLRSADTDAVLADIRGLGEVMTSATTENPDTANVTASKRGIQLHLVVIAAVPPRETATLQLAAANVPEATERLLAVVRPLEGGKGARILQSQLNEQDSRNVTANLDFEVRRSDKPAVDAALAGLGADITSRNVTRSTDTAGTLDTKVRYTLSLVNAEQIEPRETSTLVLEVPDVDRALAELRSTTAAAHGREVDVTRARDAGGQISAKIVLDVPLAASADLLAKAESLGHERVNRVARNPQVADGKLVRARYEITLGNGEALVPGDKGLGATMRSAVASSLAVLLWSLYLAVNGLLVIGPWAILLGLVWRLVRRRKRGGI